jgi:hypothetical protein
MRLLKLLRESAAAEEAHKLGLTSAGGAYWMDKTGKIVAKTVGDKLVKMSDKPKTQAAAPSVQPIVAPTPQAAPAPQAAPEKKPALAADTILGKKVGNAGGSNKGGFYEGTDGVTRYVKEYQDPTRSHAEKLANEIYSALGLVAPNAHTFPVGGKTIYASDILPGKELGDVGVTPENANKILDGFAADVLVGNWDTVGLVNDNVLITPEGEPARIDNGGTFLFRAQEASGRKPNGLLDKISEWDGFSNPSINASYSNIFKTAGLKNANDLGDRAVQQIAKIKELEQKSGGWDKIVNSAAGDMTPEDKQQVIQMLNSRSKLLYQKAQELQGQANG